jgi:hypothetical protein
LKSDDFPFSNHQKLSSTAKQRIERLDVRDHIVIGNKTKVVTVLAIPLDPLIRTRIAVTI